MAITIYRDNSANAIFIEDANGVQFLNSLHATSEAASDDVSITDLARNIEIVSNLPYGDFVNQNGDSYGPDAITVCNGLNTIFSAAGNDLGQVPVITSPLAASIVQGETLNYELVADFGVGYEWDLSNVPGVVTVDGNPRKLVGGSTLANGTYNIPVKAINYYGEDSETIVLTVAQPAFADTKSIQFDNQDWMGANAALLTALERAGNGSGSADAWSVSFWFKASGASNQNQTILYFGANDADNGNHLRIYYNGDNSARRQVILQYGSNNNRLVLKTPVGSVGSADGWQHFLVTYDGGTTGVSSGSINDYYSRFSIYINGVAQTTVNSHNNFGTTTALSGQNFRVGRYNNSAYMRSLCKVNELAIWDSDESANVAAIYNSGSTHDLSLLASAPSHWWRMGDGDTFNVIQDNIGTADFVMYNMTVADIVSDVP